MKRISLAALLLVALPAAGALAQTSPKTQTGQTQDASPNSETRPRRISPPPVQAPPANPEERPAAEQESIELAAPQGIVVGTKPESRPQVAGPAATERRVEPAAAGSSLLSPPQVQARIAEAERLLKSRPLQIAMTSPSIELVTLAALDRTSRIHLITLYKETFLTKGSELILPSSLGMPLNVRILRANGVNTAVAVFDNEGRSLVPLVVEFPIEKRGVFREMAYYTSAHPALLSPDLSRSGRAYVHRMIDLAARRLREKGNIISPQIIDVAERLFLPKAIVIYVFHQAKTLGYIDDLRRDNIALLAQAPRGEIDHPVDVGPAGTREIW